MITQYKIKSHLRQENFSWE